MSLGKTDPDRPSWIRNFTLTGLIQLFLRHHPGVRRPLRSKAGVEFKAAICSFVRAAVCETVMKTLMGLFLIHPSNPNFTEEEAGLYSSVLVLGGGAFLFLKNVNRR